MLQINLSQCRAVSPMVTDPDAGASKMQFLQLLRACNW